MFATFWSYLNGKSDSAVVKDAAKASELVLCYLSSNDDTLSGICKKAEDSRSEKEIRSNFKKVNRVMLYFQSEVKGKDDFYTTKRCLKELGISKMLSECLDNSTTLREALELWKTNIAMDVSAKVKKREKEKDLNEDFDHELIKRFFARPPCPARSLKRSYKESTSKALTVRDSSLGRHEVMKGDRKRVRMNRPEYEEYSIRRRKNINKKDYDIMRS